MGSPIPAYRIMGLCIHSELELTNVDPVECTAEDCVTLRLRAVSEPPKSNLETFGSSPPEPGKVFLARNAYGVHASIGGIGQMWFQPSTNSVDFDPETGARPCDVEHWVLGFGAGMIGAHSGRITLHASAVLLDHAAVAFLGQGGTGKTTLAASFAKSGFGLIAEDTVPLSKGDCQWLAEAYVPGIKLWPESLIGLGEVPEDFPRALSGLEKHRIPAGTWGAVASGRWPLAAAYFLSPQPIPRQTTIETSSQAVASVRFLDAMHLKEITPRRALPGLVDAAAAFAAYVPVKTVHYYRSFENLESVRDAILEDAWSIINA